MTNHDQLGAVILWAAVAGMLAGDLVWRYLHRARTRRPALTPLADIDWDQRRDELHAHDASHAARYLDTELWLEDCARKNGEAS